MSRLLRVLRIVGSSAVSTVILIAVGLGDTTSTILAALLVGVAVSAARIYIGLVSAINRLPRARRGRIQSVEAQTYRHSAVGMAILVGAAGFAVLATSAAIAVVTGATTERVQWAAIGVVTVLGISTCFYAAVSLRLQRLVLWAGSALVLVGAIANGVLMAAAGLAEASWICFGGLALVAVVIGGRYGFLARNAPRDPSRRLTTQSDSEYMAWVTHREIAAGRAEGRQKGIQLRSPRSCAVPLGAEAD